MNRMGKVVLGVLLMTSLALAEETPDTWLCITEFIASIEDDSTRPINSDSGEADVKFLLSEKGLKSFDTEIPMTDHCIFYDSGMALCKPPKDSVPVYFRMRPTGLFVLFFGGYDEDSGHFNHFLAKGNCAKL